MTADDDRAAEYRRMMTARRRFVVNLAASLRGDTAERRALAERWEPLEHWIKEGREYLRMEPDR